MNQGADPGADPADQKRRRRMTCVGCRYYFITYEPTFPYGCQLLGFKSKRAPIIEVYAATQTDCQGYEPRP